jgi:hypothetical protein
VSLPVRRLFLSGAGIALVTLFFSVMPAAALASDKDCADFRSQRSAQIFFLQHGGPRQDPDRLDGDDDGVACEDNPCPCYRGKHLSRRATEMVSDRRYWLEA